MELFKAKFAYNYMKGVVNRGLKQIPEGPEQQLMEALLLPALEEFRNQAKQQIEENQVDNRIEGGVAPDGDVSTG